MSPLKLKSREILNLVNWPCLIWFITAATYNKKDSETKWSYSVQWMKISAMIVSIHTLNTKSGKLKLYKVKCYQVWRDFILCIRLTSLSLNLMKTKILEINFLHLPKTNRGVFYCQILVVWICKESQIWKRQPLGSSNHCITLQHEHIKLVGLTFAILATEATCGFTMRLYKTIYAELNHHQ